MSIIFYGLSLVYIPQAKASGFDEGTLKTMLTLIKRVVKNI